MLLLKDLPKYECVRAIAERYPTADPDSIVTCLTLLRIASDLLGRLESFWSDHGLSQGRFTVLMLLNREAPCAKSASDLAERAGVSRATMTGLVDGLERDGLVERSTNPDDRRMAMIAITDSGQELLDGMLPDYFTLVHKLMSGLDENAKHGLVELLQGLGAGIHRVAPGDITGWACPVESAGEETPTTTPMERADA